MLSRCRCREAKKWSRAQLCIAVHLTRSLWLMGQFRPEIGKLLKGHLRCLSYGCFIGGKVMVTTGK